MAAKSDPSPPLLPVIPEYTPWLERAQEVATRDAAAADAAFAGRHGPLSAARVPDAAGSGTPEKPQGALADETA